MGEVWEAEHTRLPKHFAIKFLLALTRAEPELLMRFKREAEIASRLSHPSIVQVTDFNILPDGTAYIAMERLIGEDLRARLGRGPLGLAETREITRQVGSALQLAHREGIVHRDLKPENIFLSHEPDGSLRAKVLDFGISKLQGALGTGIQGTRDDRVLGTPGYMAPEQAMGKNSTIDGRTDLFSLATIVYEMLTGEGVFMGETLAELCTKVLFHTPPPLDEVLPSIPRPVAVAVATALSKDPAMRQPDIRSFADAVTGVVSVSNPPPERASLGFSATVASDAVPIPSVAARALAAEVSAREAARRATPDAVPVDLTDAVTRSERPAAAVASRPPGRGKKRGIAAASLAVLALIVALGYLQRRNEQSAPAETTALDLPPPHTAVTPPGLPEQPARTAEPKPAAEPVAEPTPQPQTVEPGPTGQPDPGALSKQSQSGSHVRRAEPELSASVRAALDDAERALRQGDLAGALRLSRSSLRETSSERAYFIMARAYCGQHDVGMVQAMMRNLSSALKKQVKSDCQSHGTSVP